MHSKNKLQTISLIGVQGDHEYIYVPSCGKLFQEMVICLYTFGKWFLYYTNLNQNASQISQTDWSDFAFLNSNVSNLKSLSKICSINILVLAFEGLLKKCKW